MSFLSSRKVKDVEQDLEFVKKITDKRLTQLERDLGTIQDDQMKTRRELDNSMKECKEQIVKLVGEAEAHIGNRLKNDLPPDLLSPMKAEWTKWENKQQLRIQAERDDLDKTKRSTEAAVEKLKDETQWHMLSTAEKQQSMSEEFLAKAREEYLELGRSLVALSEMKSIEEPSSANTETEESRQASASRNTMGKDDERIIWLNVGGKTFCASSKPLEKSLFFDALLSGRKNATKDREGRFFIDRNPESFHFLLEFLRTGTLPRNISKDLRTAVRRDATFFVVPTLQDHMDKSANNRGDFVDIWRSTVQGELKTLHERESAVMKSASGALLGALEGNQFWIFGERPGGSLGGKEMLLVYLAPPLDSNRSYAGDELGIGRRCEATIWHPDNQDIRHLVVTDRRVRKLFRAYLTETYGVSFDTFFPNGAVIGPSNAICVLGLFLVGAKIRPLSKVVRMNFGTWSSSFSFDCAPEEEDSMSGMCTIS
uniref:BTB domain-containing protein n=1 Tax=Odontella aurita TaxID=265563 RepID=A0A7S4HJ33_9STRA|mmetsp:Transcript_10797/g.31973  ORF Transcript_10797/g.31973 Transcript_10797/m.31973 type:complete len:483 (+) Transcript_10797:165-1613(+)